MNIKESVMSGLIPENLRILDAHAHLGDGEMCIRDRSFRDVLNYVRG